MTTVVRPTVADLPDRDGVMEQSQHENFTVAGVVLGRERRRHLLAIYGYARLVDDVGDEAVGDRMALLDVVETEIDRIYSGEPPRHPVMAALAETVRACRLPQAPFRRLVEANRSDQELKRYETFDQLLAYCQLSAAPVGELVLGVFGAATPARIALSDRICAGLQIVEHLQDVAEDHARGRVYLPREDLVRFACDDADLASDPVASCRALIAFEAERAGALLSSGAPLARTLPARPRMAVAGFVAGGRRALDDLLEPALSTQHRRAARRRRFAARFARAAMGR
ncbi:MAG: squalene synthase HpnC [Solirubrobacteraceae bacterium]